MSDKTLINFLIVVMAFFAIVAISLMFVCSSIVKKGEKNFYDQFAKNSIQGKHSYCEMETNECASFNPICEEMEAPTE